MRRHARRLLERHAPGIFEAIRAIRNRQYFYRQFSQLHAEVRAMLFPGTAPITVQRGPFHGMRYFAGPVWGSITPKWLGSYEAELHGVIAEVHSIPYDTIIDIGSAEGYYAVGLALLQQRARIFAFDTDFISRGQTRRLGRLNGVDQRLHLGARCRHEDINRLASGRTLVVCDIEGGEADLLNPTLATALLKSDILVEVHEDDETSRYVESLLANRFQASHQIIRIAAEGRLSWMQQQEELEKRLGRTLLLRAMDERRSKGNIWLWMRCP
jgi:hypothetical protein